MPRHLPPESLKKPSIPDGVVVVLEDDRPTSDLLCLTLKRGGLVPLPCYALSEANEVLHGDVRIVGMIIDLSLPDGDGIQALRCARKIHERLPCFILTGKDSVETAVTAMKAGAENYLIKPFEPTSLMAALKSAVNAYVSEADGVAEDAFSLHGVRRWRSLKMRKALETAKAAASKSFAPVLITGGECTGKGRFAQLVYGSAKKRYNGFTSVNLKSLSPARIETELFGAPLGNLHDKYILPKGKLEKCRGQVLYLENVDHLHPAAQDYLLQWLIDDSLIPSGTLPPCRIVSSSSIDLMAAVKKSAFRKDLWFALAVHHIEVPSLAERSEDIPALCESIITRICVTRKLRRPSLTKKAIEVLMDHNWPGNLSELYNYLEHAISKTSDDLIGPEDFPLMSRQPSGSQPHVSLQFGTASIEEINKMTLLAALDACGGNRRRAAQRLKISLRTIYNMIERYDLPRKNRMKRDSDD